MKVVTFSWPGTGIFPLLPLLVFILSIPGTGAAADQVTGRYLAGAGRTISVELDVPETPPTTIIVSQTIPAGVTVQRTSPAAKKIATRDGTIKWLLDSISPGRSIVTMELDRPVNPGEVRGEIHYRDPVTSKPVTVPISPPSP